MLYLAEVFSFNFSRSFLQNLHQYLAEGSSFFSRSFFSKFYTIFSRLFFFNFSRSLFSKFHAEEFCVLTEFFNFSRIFFEEAHSQQKRVNFLNFFLLKLKSFWDPRSQDHVFCRYGISPVCTMKSKSLIDFISKFIQMPFTPINTGSSP